MSYIVVEKILNQKLRKKWKQKQVTMSGEG